MPARAKIIVEPKKFDHKKEKVFKDLAAKLEFSGFVVRREKLKSGPGWKVVSGTCRSGDSKLIFVDGRLSQDDQIAFLANKIVAAGLVPAPDQEAA